MTKNDSQVFSSSHPWDNGAITHMGRLGKSRLEAEGN